MKPSKIFPHASRLNRIPPYLFAALDRLKAEYILKGEYKIIDLGEGNPLFFPEKRIIAELVKALDKLENHRYPTYAGSIETRKAVADWYQRRFNVKLDPETEVVIVLGTKEGIAHLFWALIDKGDIAYIPSPSYPVYLNQTLLAGGEPIVLPLREENDFLPDLSKIKANKKAKLLVLNYPNNPTTAVAPISFYQDVVNKALQYGFYCFNDNVYSELYYETPPHSILEVPGAKECCIEFHSLSKTFSICGWRIGFAVGNKEILKALLKVKQNVDSGPFGAIQEAAIFALNNTEKFAAYTRKAYQKRLSLFAQGLQTLGWNTKMPKATFYLWTKIPYSKYKNDSQGFAGYLLQKTGILVAPGIGFGDYGEGYIRFALIQPLGKIKTALNRLQQLKR
ncbi:MAG: aminotransferase class I/II-fold pyridoxal phosphate-dependent enzyme [candidate division WOR-3 bacterium]|nr:aminotransferase class I/II-fold pyridoxal phosphate-dependent enzyme [candidate division WOR-3 bacterium]